MGETTGSRRWRPEGGRRFDNTDLATEEVIGDVADASAGDMRRAIAAARRAFDETGWSTDHQLRNRRRRCPALGRGTGGGALVRAMILDNEAIQALVDARHRKHRLVLAHLDGITQRRRRGNPTSVLVPTAVRVEAGWDRSDARLALANRLRIADRGLAGDVADVAAQIVGRTGVSVADAHVGATARLLDAKHISVLSSDPADMIRASAPRQVTAIRI